MPLRSATRFAPAKVNLYLHVGAVAADGYHPLHSLMVFADVGDRIDLTPSDQMAFGIEGPFAAPLDAESDNLVVRARNGLLAQLGSAPPPFRLTLYKALPLAAGLGGGSSDAAATLRLVDDVLGTGHSSEALHRLALALGSDTPACLAARSVLASGRGERLAAPPPFPSLDAVLVNPRAPAPTGAVYRQFDAAAGVDQDAAPVWPAGEFTPKTFADFLDGCRNDLEAPAISVQPLVATVLHSLRSDPLTLLGRMSGSGATCFAICRDAADASLLAARLTLRHPDWWVTACRFTGS